MDCLDHKDLFDLLGFCKGLKIAGNIFVEAPFGVGADSD